MQRPGAGYRVYNAQYHSEIVYRNYYNLSRLTSDNFLQILHSTNYPNKLRLRTAMRPILASTAFISTTALCGISRSEILFLSTPDVMYNQ